MGGVFKLWNRAENEFTLSCDKTHTSGPEESVLVRRTVEEV